MLIYVCLSSHGYGHASRTAAVLQHLARHRPHWRFVLSTAVSPSFLQLALGDVRHELRTCRWDVGVVQADALGADAPATLAALQILEGDLPAQLATEARWLQDQAEPTLVLADVPPAAALLAARLSLPLVWLASFGWDAIYAPMGEPFQAHAQACRDLYARGDLLLRCPLDLPMDWGVPAIPLGLTTSEPRMDAQVLRRQLRLPPDRERCVLISFGGLGKAYDPALLRRWPDHVLIGPDQALAAEPNGRVLPEGLRPLDLMPLCARLITKPGYSSFCEAFSQGLGIHLVRRSGFAEAPVLEEALRRHGHHRLLEPAAFERGAWELDQPLLPPSQEPLACDGAATAAEALVRKAEERSAVPIDKEAGV
ncbi:MAG: hypothetical protein ACKOZT_02735 [Cyanobium sp.]